MEGRMAGVRAWGVYSRCSLNTGSASWALALSVLFALGKMSCKMPSFGACLPVSRQEEVRGAPAVVCRHWKDLLIVQSPQGG